MIQDSWNTVDEVDSIIAHYFNIQTYSLHDAFDIRSKKQSGYEKNLPSIETLHACIRYIYYILLLSLLFLKELIVYLLIVKVLLYITYIATYLYLTIT